MNCPKAKIGSTIPCMGFGTHPMNGAELQNALENAINCGYLLIDTACSYGNHLSIGETIKKHSEKLYLQTKLSWKEQYDIFHSNRSWVNVIDQILSELQTSQIDLLLVHWPYPDFLKEVWACMEEMKEAGVVKSIGLCNVKRRHLESVLSFCKFAPEVVQIEIHPLNAEFDYVHWCHQQGLIVEAFCPLGLMKEEIRNSKVLNVLAAQYEKSIAQIIIRWHIQRNIVPLPKSSSEIRIKQNIDIFDFNLTDDDMNSISRININQPFYTPSFYCPGY